MQEKKITGLTSTEAQERLKKYGFNELKAKESPWYVRLFKRFWGPIPWMIETSAILSYATHRYEDLTIILILLFVNAFVDFYQEAKALSAIAILKEKLARFTLVLRDGTWQKIEAKYLVPDDVIKLKIGDIVPADATLHPSEQFLTVDQSALTGESLPVTKKGGEILYANAIIKQGEMMATVTATAQNTYFGKTVGLVAKAEHEQKSHFQKMVMQVGNFLIALTVVMIILILGVGYYRGESMSELLIFSLVLTISAIPVAMPAVLTVTMAVGARVLAAKEAIVSRLPAIEELAGMDILCSDKTGTLTQNIMSLSEPYVVEGFDSDALYYYAALASKKENDDPIEKPIFEKVTKEHMQKLERYNLKEFIPFDPVRKRTEGVYETDKGTLHVIKGATQVVLSLCDLSKESREKVHSNNHSFASKGFRSLGVAYRYEDEEKFHLVGLVPLFDPPREDSKEAIEEAKARGVTVKMVTGDNIAVAQYIASLLDIGKDIEDIQALKGQTHQEQVIEKEDGFAQVFPEDKYFIVDKLQKAGHIVGMTGDGVNDAPALKKADCGIAVSGATDAARAAADIVLMTPGLRVIVDAIKQARITFERMKSYTVYRIAETIRIIIFMSLAIVVFQFYPVTALMIIILALLNDLPILAIAYDNTKVQESPVKWDMKEILVLSSWLGIAGVFSSFGIFAYVMYYMQLPLELVQSIFFVKLVVAGHGTIFNTRTDSWFFKQPRPSFVLWSASLVSAIAGTIIAVYGFGLMEPIGWKWAGFMWLYAGVWFLFNDSVKILVLRWYRKHR